MNEPRFIVSSVTGLRDGRRRAAEAKAAELNEWDERGA